MSCTSTVELQTTRSVSRDVRDETILGYRLTYECYFNSDGGDQQPPPGGRSADPKEEEDC
jgi:hypothetical protein